MMFISRASIVGRYFILGSARSGTTLLQAMLANHPEIFSFPESHFFCRAAPRGRLRRRLGIARRPLVKGSLEYLFELLGQHESENPIPRWSPLFGSYTKIFVRAVDSASLKAGKRMWVEKTPHHIDFIPLITRRVKRSRFIHILRDGRDVIASQYHAQQQDPSYWKNWTTSQLVHQWNMDVQKSLAYRRDARHLVISYEELVGNPDFTLRQVASFMNLEFNPAMLRHWEATDQILGSRRSEPWMQTAYKPLEDRRGKKFASIFTAEQRRVIEANLMWAGNIGHLLHDGHSATQGQPTPRIGSTA